MKTPSAYAAAGVNITLGDKLKARLPQLVARTRQPGCLGKIGGFGGLFELDTKRYRRPVLVSSADGVGTKLKIAVMTGRHDTVGEDLVNHCVNDIAVLGSKPLYFLDYIGMGRLEPAVFHQLIAGLAKACAEAKCALIGGETAQLPDMYAPGEYDLAGTIVGVIERDRILDGSRICPGDALIGLPSNGLHTNGYTLARKILFGELGYRFDDRLEELGCTIADELLKVHRNYGPLILKLRDRKSPLADALKGCAHITGGGFTGNIPRILPKNADAVIRRASWPVPPIFSILQSGGNVSDEEMHEVFNMGIGMVFVVVAAKAEAVRRACGKGALFVGEIVKGKGVCRLQ
jgi:phosphoribosylformylglycinamidine cyclo-ligase